MNEDCREIMEELESALLTLQNEGQQDYDLDLSLDIFISYGIITRKDGKKFLIKVEEM